VGRIISEGPARVSGGGAAGHGLRPVSGTIRRQACCCQTLARLRRHGVLEIVEDHDGDTYRAVHTVHFAETVYVLHAFQKKATHGIATLRHEVDLISTRLAAARDLHEQRAGRKGTRP